MSTLAWERCAVERSSWTWWWKHNQYRFLEVHPLARSLSLRTGEMDARASAEAARSLGERMRSAYVPALERALASSDATVRAAAAVTLGRTGGFAAVDPLLAALEDPSARVRERAILGLGATGSERARTALLSIARRGSLNTAGGSITGAARGYAIVALAVGRGVGFDVATDQAVLDIAHESAGADRNRVAQAAFLYRRLAPSPPFDAFALEVAASRSRALTVRTRAIEALGASASPGVAADLIEWLGGPNLELRRSAALALARSPSDLALPALIALQSDENEPVARGFQWLAIGELGGEIARASLLDALRTADASTRPWAALGLGLCARGRSDPLACAALRFAESREKNREVLPAYWLASGIARDELALDPIACALERSSSAEERSFAALALASIGGEDARAILLNALVRDSAPAVRAAIARAVAHLGKSADAAVLVRVLTELDDPALRAQVTFALAVQGSTAGLSHLMLLLESPGTDDQLRAAAVDAVGMLLGCAPPLAVTRTAEGANYSDFETWVDELLEVTL